MKLGKWVYLDQNFVTAGKARISPFDRAFLFSHAAYEVTAFYNGKLIDFDGHLQRLERTLAALDIPMPEQSLADLHGQPIERNGLKEGLIYLQVSAGDYGHRDFYGPENFVPTLFMFAVDKQLINDAARDGIEAITLPDTRWARRDLKTTQLLSQSLAYRKARQAGATTAYMHEDGVITEAASANIWIVTTAGKLVTRPLSEAILPGITRDAVIDLFSASSLRIEERLFTVDEVKSATETFTSSAGAIIAPVTKLDGIQIGNGQPGPITRRVQRAYYERMGADIATAAPWISS